jgi:hypothetical protein
MKDRADATGKKSAKVNASKVIPSMSRPSGSGLGVHEWEYRDHWSTIAVCVCYFAQIDASVQGGMKGKEGEAMARVPVEKTVNTK